MIYFSTKLGLRIVIKPEKLFRDKNDNPRKEEGHYIKFVNGKYETNDKQEIAFMKEYMNQWKGEITVIDPAKVARDQRIHELARQIIEEEDEKEMQKIIAEESKAFKEAKKEAEEEQAKIDALLEKKKKQVAKEVAEAQKNDKVYLAKKEEEIKKKLKEKASKGKKVNEEIKKRVKAEESK